jgi:hypothetical protein
MSRRRACSVIGLVAAGLLAATVACGRPGAQTPPPLAPPPPSEAALKLDALTAGDDRVGRIAWRLATANADLCPLTRPSAGWFLQSANQYSDDLKRVAEARYGLEGDLPGVLAAPAGGPAARAGLAPGDLILAVNGVPVPVGEVSAGGRYEGLEANAARLNDAVADGPVQLSVRRAGQVREVRLTPVPACAYNVELHQGNGSMVTRQGSVLISQRMANLAQSDDELAFVIAHELSHLVLEHDRGPNLRGERGAANPQITLRRGRSSGYEADADRMGLYLLTRAGFDPRAAAAYLTREPDLGPQISLASGAIYRSPSDRRRVLEPILADIAERQAAGRSLIP